MRTRRLIITLAVVAAPVTTRPYTDERTVSVRLDLGRPWVVTAPVGGRVTDLSCQSGATIASGSSPLAVNGVPVLALSTSVPWWRDIPLWGTGADVDALHDELRRLGFDVAGDGDRAGAQTFAGIRALLKRIGVDLPRTNRLPLTSAIWLPAPEVTVVSCSVSVGDFVGPGTEVFRTPPALRGADVLGMRRPAVGDYALRLGDASIPVPDDGRVTDPAALATIAASDAFASALADAGDGTLTATLALAEPLTVAVVPPMAVITGDGVTGCVVAGGRLHAIRVVGSQLGQTFVVFDDGVVPDAVSLTLPATSSCG